MTPNSKPNYQMFIDYQYRDQVDYWTTNHFYGNDKFPLNNSYQFDISDFIAEQHIRGDDYHYKWVRERNIRIVNFKEKVRNNLRCTFESRIYISHYYKYIKNRLKEFGQSEDNDEKLDILNDVRNQVSQSVIDSLTERVGVLVAQCPSCGNYYPSDELRSVYRSDDMCNDCIDSGSYYFSECMDMHVHRRYVGRVYSSTESWYDESPDDYCSISYGRDNYFEHYDSIGNFFESEWDRDDVCSSESDDDVDEDYPSHESRYFCGYHGSRRDYTEVNATGAYPALGLELEVWTSDRKETIDCLGEKYYGPFVFERDGSLNDEHGFEIVSMPFGREEWLTKVPDITATLKENEVVGFNDPAGSGYGIHVTIHRRHFSQLAEARIAMFMANEINTNFIKAVAQRDAIYAWSSGINIGGIAEKAKFSNIIGGIERNYTLNRRKIIGRGKYCPVNWKEDLAEFRIFQSTVNPSSILKNFEFVWALHAWTKTEACTGSSFDHRDFVKWLNTADRRKEFPFLTNFLSKKVFYGTNFSPITSTWHHLTHKPSDEEAVEPMFA